MDSQPFVLDLVCGTESDLPLLGAGRPLTVQGLGLEAKLGSPSLGVQW